MITDFKWDKLSVTVLVLLCLSIVAGHLLTRKKELKRSFGLKIKSGNIQYSILVSRVVIANNWISKKKKYFIPGINVKRVNRFIGQILNSNSLTFSATYKIGFQSLKTN
jgi:hypothetical protein